MARWPNKSKEEKELQLKFRGRPRPKEEVERIEANRRPDGTFGAGTSGFPGGGLRKMRESTYFADALHEVFDQLGGVAGLYVWAQKYPGRFYDICSKLLPVQLAITRDEQDRTVTVTHVLKAPNYNPAQQMLADKQGSGGATGLGSTIEYVNTPLTPQEVTKAFRSMDKQQRRELLSAMGYKFKPKPKSPT